MPFRDALPDSAITPALLLAAYAQGIFPMAASRTDPEVHWLCPSRRGVIFLDHFAISRRLARTVRNGPLTASADCAFSGVLSGCARCTPGRPESWINDTIIQLYQALFDRGHCHSVEVWREGQLVGGVYGVCLGRVFFGESMYSTIRDASKIALVHLAARLIAGDFAFIDTQFLTDHLARFGAVEIARNMFLERLASAVRERADFNALPSAISGAQALEIIASHRAQHAR